MQASLVRIATRVCGIMVPVLLASRAAAQGTRIDLAIGPAVGDVGSVTSTNRWGGQIQLGVLAGGTSHLAVHAAAAGSGFGEPGCDTNGGHAGCVQLRVRRVWVAWLNGRPPMVR